MVACGRFHFYVVDFRSYAKRRVGRKCPRRGRPSDDVTTVYHFKPRRAGEIFDITVTTGLVELVGRETRSGSRRIRLNGITLIEVTFFIELFEEIPKGLDVLVVVRDIGVVKIDSITHLFGERSPFGGVFHHLAATSGIIFIDGNLFADILLGDTEHFLNA